MHVDLTNWKILPSLSEKNIPLHTNRVLQRIQMKLILLIVWAEWAVMGGTKTALKFKYEI